jgi:hypothetical protein
VSVIAKVKLGCCAAPPVPDDELVEVVPLDDEELGEPPCPLLDEDDDADVDDEELVEVDEELVEEVEEPLAPLPPVPSVTSVMPRTCWQLATPSAVPRARSAVRRLRLESVLLIGSREC